MRITADTNVLVRAVTEDHEHQSKAAQTALKKAELVAIPISALCELVWVLSQGYKIPSSEIAEAIRRAQEGDAEAFGRLYRLHSGRVYALCLRMMNGNAAEAEDLTQEAFLQLFRKISTFRAESAFSTWLHRVTFNIALMRLRKKKKLANEFSMEETNGPDEEAGGGECAEGDGAGDGAVNAGGVFFLVYI